jgi:mannosyltransferase OCH1-like enzyme
MARGTKLSQPHNRGKTENSSPKRDSQTGKLTPLLGVVVAFLIIHEVASMLNFQRGFATDYSNQLWSYSALGNMSSQLLQVPDFDFQWNRDWNWGSFVSASSTTNTTINTDNNVLPIEQLVNTEGAKTITCPPPLKPFQDVVVPPNLNLPTPLIPRVLHVTFKHRCLPEDLAFSLEQWQSSLPDYSIYFHDDDAVDTLINSEWPEFPMLHQLMQCVQFKGAMKIDLWRLLILYRYGGVYTDIDNWPQDKFQQHIIQPTDSAFMFSDANFRPSQWFFAMEPHHPWAYFCLMTIFDNLLNLPNIAQPKVVATTGPLAMYYGTVKYLTQPLFDTMAHQELTVLGPYNKTFHKIPTRYTEQYILGSLGGHSADTIEYNGTQMTRRDRMEQQSGVIHWDKIVYWNRHARAISCMEYILERQLNQTFTRPRQVS